MMQSITDIQNGLYDFLIGIPGIPTAIQVENERFVPNIRNPWIRTLLVPAETTKQSQGINGLNRLSGIYAVDLYYPAGRTTVNNINLVADTIINSYIEQLYINSNSTYIQILSAWRNTSTQDGDWIQIPVTIRWESQAARS